jgi:hypothetical protein
MKRPNEPQHSNFLPESSTSQHTAARSRHSRRSPPRHYHHIRRIQQFGHQSVPGMVVHYPIVTGSPTSPDIHRHLCLLASQPSSFPEVFLPTTVMLVIDTGASITITNDPNDFIEPP